MGKSWGIINSAYVHQSVFHQNVKSTASLHLPLWPKGPIPFDIFLSHSSLSVLTMMCLDLCITHVSVTHWPHPIWDFPVPFFIVCVNYDVLICASQMCQWPTGPIPFEIFQSHSSLFVLTMMCLDLCIKLLAYFEFLQWYMWLCWTVPVFHFPSTVSSVSNSSVEQLLLF